MIPKKIHYVWLGTEENAPLPSNLQSCVDSWKNLCPDYEIVRWDMDKIKHLDNMFMREAIAKRKWAFASDFIRLYAIYHEGGIYLDTDFMLGRRFDDLLHHRMFIGREGSFHVVAHFTEHFLTSHCFGAEAGHPYIKRCLDYYEGRRFITGSCPEIPVSLLYDMTLLPQILSDIAKQWGYSPSTRCNHLQQLPDGLTVYPSDYFDSMSMGGNSYGRHLAMGSWRETRLQRRPVTWRYKIEWRIVKLMRSVLNRMGYEIIETN